MDDNLADLPADPAASYVRKPRLPVEAMGSLASMSVGRWEVAGESRPDFPPLRERGSGPSSSIGADARHSGDPESDQTLALSSSSRASRMSRSGPATLPPSHRAALDNDLESDAPTMLPSPSVVAGLNQATGVMPSPTAGYELVRPIGRGGMGEVFEAIQLSLGRVVAVKRIRDDIAETAQQRAEQEALFRQEAVTSARLEHPNILPVHDLGMDERGRPLLAMKLVEGRPWDRLLREDFAAMPVTEFLAKHLQILIGMAQAVAYAHSRGIIHRDLKPAQVMVGAYGEVLLADWGLAIDVAESRPPLSPRVAMPPLPTRETASNPCGTPAMMAPEQTSQDAKSIGPWTDIFLLGGTLYYVLTGSFPHNAPSSNQAMMLARECEVEPPSRRAPERSVPPQLEELAMRCLAKDPAARLSSAREFVDGLNDYLSGASRRRESAAIVEKARALIDEAQDYSTLSECLSQVERASSLWPENPDTAPLRERLLIAQAEEALRNSDLLLARVSVERLPKGRERERLYAEVREAENQLRTQRRQRRVFLTATVSLLMIVTIGAIVAGRQVLASERNARTQVSVLEKARDEATAKLSDAEARLAAATINGQEALATLEPTLDYFRSLSGAQLDPSTRLAKASAFARAADLHTAAGNTVAAADSWRIVDESMAPLGPDAPGAGRALRVRALLALGRREPARELAERLLAEKYGEPSFLRLCREQGFAR
jgi:serine/threonine protein kinase